MADLTPVHDRHEEPEEVDVVLPVADPARAEASCAALLEGPDANAITLVQA